MELLLWNLFRTGTINPSRSSANSYMGQPVIGILASERQWVFACLMIMRG